jgi:hypothetical protein
MSKFNLLENTEMCCYEPQKKANFTDYYSKRLNTGVGQKDKFTWHAFLVPYIQL